jgi:inosine-uridine nucleoside N-ribohydrolase
MSQVNPEAVVEKNTEKWLIVDTDAGVDDAFAIALAAKVGPLHGYKLKLLMTSHGNTSEENVYVNCKKTLAGCEVNDVKVARGAKKPVSTVAIDASYFHGMDGLGDVCPTAFEYTETEITDNENKDNKLPSSSNASMNNAQIALLDLLKEKQKNTNKDNIHVTLVTLGPLTNLAEIILNHSKNEDLDIDIDIDIELLKEIDHLVIMGGSANGLGNVTRTAEFNVHADAEAAHSVFTYPWDEICNCIVTCVSWDICKDAAIPYDIFDQCCHTTDTDNTLLPPPPTVAIPVAGYYDKCREAGLTHLGCFLRSICYSPYVTQREPLEPVVGDELDIDTATLPSDSSENKRGNKGAVICDCLAVAIALTHGKAASDDIVSSIRMTNIEVECTSNALTRGCTVCDFGHCYDGISRKRNIRWVTAVNNDLYIKNFIQLFK